MANINNIMVNIIYTLLTGIMVIDSTDVGDTLALEYPSSAGSTTLFINAIIFTLTFYIHKLCLDF